MFKKRLSFDKNRWLLASMISALSLLILIYSSSHSPKVLIAVAMVLLILVIIFFEPLYREVQNLSGQFSRNDDSYFFEIIIELNRKFQNLLNIEDVLEVLDRTLKERAGLDGSVFIVSSKLLLGMEKISGESYWYKWGRGAENTPVDFDDLEKVIQKTNYVYDYASAEEPIQKFMEQSSCDVMLPIVLDNQLSFVLLLQTGNSGAMSKHEGQMYAYLANQLSLILDRVRIYQHIMIRTKVDHAEKLQVMQSLSANIAHEMRTPLSGIRASITGIENYLPELIRSYEYASHHNEEFKGIHGPHLSNLKATPDRIKLMIDQANTVIDMLLINLRGESYDKLIGCSATSCVKQAVERYPFKSGEREKVHIYLDEEFIFQGVEILFIYILFNLLKNAFYSIRSAQKGEIEISLEKGEEWNYLIFRDTGAGMEPEVLNNIFENFFTTKDEGTGVGLTFCKRTLTSFGGDIACDSTYGVFTEFRIKLPVTKEKKASELFH